MANDSSVCAAPSAQETVANMTLTACVTFTGGEA